MQSSILKIENPFKRIDQKSLSQEKEYKTSTFHKDDVTFNMNNKDSRRFFNPMYQTEMLPTFNDHKGQQSSPGLNIIQKQSTNKNNHKQSNNQQQIQSLSVMGSQFSGNVFNQINLQKPNSLQKESSIHIDNREEVENIIVMKKSAKKNTELKHSVDSSQRQADNLFPEEQKDIDSPSFSPVSRRRSSNENIFSNQV